MDQESVNADVLEDMSKPERLHVSQLVVRDYMRIEEVAINASGRSLVIIKGPNDAGKTTALRAMISALSGGRADPEEPIRHGAATATVDVTIADEQLRDRYSVALKFSAKGRSLVVTDLSPEIPMRMSRPQTVLDGIVGRLAFDPLKFDRASDAERVGMLYEAFGLADAYEEYVARRASLVATRRDAKKVRDDRETRLRLAQAGAAGLQGMDRTPIDVEAVTEELKAARGMEKRAAEASRKVTEKAIERDALAADVDRLHSELSSAEGRRLEAARMFDDMEAAVVKMSRDVPNIDELTARLASAADHNQKIAALDSLDVLRGEVDEARAMAEGAEDAVEDVDDKFRAGLGAAVEAANIPGLTVEAEGVIRQDGVLFNQLGGSQRLRLSAALGMLSNPTLRIMGVDEADCLDPSSMQTLNRFAESQGHQLWLTGVWLSSDVAQTVEMSDGRAVEGGGDAG